jgi:hypothetical protein
MEILVGSFAPGEIHLATFPPGLRKINKNYKKHLFAKFCSQKFRYKKLNKNMCR